MPLFDILVSGTRESALTADEARRGLTGRLFRHPLRLGGVEPCLAARFYLPTVFRIGLATFETVHVAFSPAGFEPRVATRPSDLRRGEGDATSSHAENLMPHMTAHEPPRGWLVMLKTNDKGNPFPGLTLN